MSAHEFLSAALDASMEALTGGDTITINSEVIPAVIDPTTETEDLMMGGEGDHRSVTMLVASSTLDPLPRKGDTVQYGDQDWKINAIDHHPATTTRLTLHAPGRRV